MKWTNSEGKINYRVSSDFLKELAHNLDGKREKIYISAPNSIRVKGTRRPIILGHRDLSNAALKGSVWWSNDPAPTTFFLIIFT